MQEKAHRSIHIKWVRSGIGFPYRQKAMIRSLGLLRLNQVVERPDTPQIRGLVANIPHLVSVVSEPVKPVWVATPEYNIFPPEVAARQATPPIPAERDKEVKEATAAGEVAVAAAGSAEEKAEEKVVPAVAEAAKPKKQWRTAAKGKAGQLGREKGARAVEAKKRGKAAKEKAHKTRKAGKK